MNIVILGSKLVKPDGVVYKKYKSSDYKIARAAYIKYGPPNMESCILEAEHMLCTESDYNVLENRLKFHPWSGKYVYDEIRHSDLFDIHLQGGRTHGDIIILFTYDHKKKNIWFLDMGTHDELVRKGRHTKKQYKRIQSSIEPDNELIWL